MPDARVSAASWLFSYTRKTAWQTICLLMSTIKLSLDKNEDAPGTPSPIFFCPHAARCQLHTRVGSPRLSTLAYARAGTCSRAGHHFGPTTPRPSPPASIASALTTAACSKEDEDILKAEYFQNPKPDKAARLRIVRQVALGEKEVQVRPQTSVSRHLNAHPAHTKTRC